MELQEKQKLLLPLLAVFPMEIVLFMNFVMLLRSYKNHEPIIEPRDIPLPAIRESYLGERKKVVLRVRHRLRRDPELNLFAGICKKPPVRKRRRGERCE
jgi:hypothetical protein